MVRNHYLLFCVATLATFRCAYAQEELLRFQNWRVTSAGTLNCAGLPVLDVQGSPDVLGRREDLQSLTKGLAAVVGPRCPNLREVILNSGRARRLIVLPRVAASAPVAAAAPAPAPAVPPATKPTVPDPPPPTPPRVELSKVITPTPTPAPAPATAVPAPGLNVALAGTWIGIYQVYPAYVQMTLKIAGEPEKGGVGQAELRVEGLDGKNAPHMGVTNATIRYQHEVRVLEIIATAGGAAYGRNNLMGLSFRAAYDADRRVFAGYRTNASTDASPYFVLVRQGQEGKFFDRLQDMPNGASARQRLPINIGGDSPSAERLGAWASQIYKEYADINPYGTEFGSLYLKARNLFRDEHFRPFFGKNYDELGGSDMGKINRRLETLPRPRANFPEDRANSAAIPMGRGFWVNVGTYAAPDIMLSVIAMRSMSGWMNQTLRRLPGMAATADVFQTLNGLEAEEQGILGTFWPSEREAFVKAIDAQRSRLADPVLLTNVSGQIEGASRFGDIAQLQQTLSVLRQPGASSSSTRQPVRNVPAVGRRAPPVTVRTTRASGTGTDIASLAAMASETNRQQLAMRVENKISDLVEAEVKNDAAAIAGFPSGLAGLETGAQWYSRTERKYAAFRASTSVTAMFQQFGQSRNLQHTQGAPALRAQIARLPSAEQIDGLIARYLSIGSDRSAPTAQPIFDAVQKRKAELEQMAAENRRKAAEEAARKAEEARIRAESMWRRPKPADTQVVKIGLADMLPKPNSTPLQQASEAVVAVLTPNSFGSAFLITKDGLAITNNHVVEGASALRARFPSGEEYAVRTWRTDPENDFALIQIDCPKDCFTSYLTTDALPGPGTDIFTIGTPKDPRLSNTVTKGIVSGLRRMGTRVDIQVDAAINGGNSGGPVIEAATGRVLGVVTWKRRDAEGIGFAGSVLDALRLLKISIE